LRWKSSCRRSSFFWKKKKKVILVNQMDDSLKVENHFKWYRDYKLLPTYKFGQTHYQCHKKKKMSIQEQSQVAVRHYKFAGSIKLYRKGSQSCGSWPQHRLIDVLASSSECLGEQTSLGTTWFLFTSYRLRKTTQYKEGIWFRAVLFRCTACFRFPACQTLNPSPAWGLLKILSRGLQFKINQ
jgi:hypothetical protein